jgi:hypothetical protein
MVIASRTRPVFLQLQNGTLSIDEAATNHFEVHRTPNGKFYITSGGATSICTGTGSVVYFDEEREALEFLVEMIDTVTDRALGRPRQHQGDQNAQAEQRPAQSQRYQ